MIYPHIIHEANATYHIGELKWDTVNYDFTKMLEYLQVKGKMMFGQHFKIYPEDYGTDGYYCFDDLGEEHTGRHYGKDCNVMGEILLSRYELFTNSEPQHLSANASKRGVTVQKQNRLMTHITTNLNAEELGERYGARVRSRMRAMFNLISFSSHSSDKRI